MEKYKPVASIDIPSDLSGNQPLCLIDPKTNALVVVDNALKWMQIVDLQPLIDREKADAGPGN